MELAPLHGLLRVGLVPLVYGDVALDAARGCTIISTERIFSHLARQLHPARVLLASDASGVHTADPFQDPDALLISRITPDALPQLQAQLAGAHGPDVTGGMLSKVQMMCELVEAVPSLTVRVLSGLEPGLIYRALLDPQLDAGTLICASGTQPLDV
jgi:isopentenyl phosphate kinase